jgi:NAD(P)H-dependent FMN reductase
MKTIYAISGSAGEQSSNRRLIDSLGAYFRARANWFPDDLLCHLPLYRPALDSSPVPEIVSNWRAACQACDAVIICTPEYLHNIPAVLKNGLEWLKSSGELSDKPLLNITFTPKSPRGEYAMKSLSFSTLALGARVVAELPLYKTDFAESGELYLFTPEHLEVFSAALELLGV